MEICIQQDRQPLYGKSIKSYYTKLMKRILTILFCLSSVLSFSQGYSPSKHIPINDAIFPAQKAPINGRKMYYDTTLFLYRAFNGKAEALTNLSTQIARFGFELVVVHEGGTLNGDGSFTGGVNNFYWFRNGLLDADFVKAYVDSVIVPKSVVYVKRLTDSTFYAARTDSTRDTVLIRGTAAGGINSLTLTAPTQLFGTPVNFSNAGGAWTGSLVLNNQHANYVFAGPSTGGPGSPSWRQLVIADMPVGIPNGNLQNSSIGFASGTSGTDINWSATPISLGGTATLNVPNASPTARG